MEYLNLSLGQPYNLVIVLRIKGLLSKDEFKIALSKLQEKHPLLKVRIEVDDNGRYWFTSNEVGEIPIEVIEFENDSKTSKFFLNNLEKPFDMEDIHQPLFRVTLLHSLKQNDIILCAQHTITDGLSMAFLTRDLIHFLNNPDLEPAALNSPMSKEDIFPPKIRKKIPNSAFRTRTLYLFLRIYYFLKYGKNRNDLRSSTDYKEDDLRLISWNLSKEETDLLIQLCKQNGVSVHSAVCTAFLPDISIINNPVNLRERLNYPVGEAFGLYASGAVVKLRYKKNQDYWSNAKRYQKRLYFSLRDKKVYKIHKMVHIGVPIELLKELAPLFLEIASHQQAFAITNLGSLDRMGIELDSNKFSIDSFYGAISFAIGAITVLVYTMRGKMYFNFHYLESRHDAQKMITMAENAKSRLLGLLLKNS